MSAAETLLGQARRAGLTIAVAESCTGGGLGAALTAPAGASDVMMGGLITYSNASKEALLGVNAATLATFGAVSEEVAAEMAQGTLRALRDAQLSISITGIAGPGGSDVKPEGRVCFATTLRGGETYANTMDFGPLGRKQVRSAATHHAIKLLSARIL